MIPKNKAHKGLTIQVLAGGISHEREISLKSGRRVADALTEAGATVIMREPDQDLLTNIKKDKPDVIWPTLHGASGEDGALRDILALTGVPFVGASGPASRLAWDKSIAKVLVSKAGVQTPASITLPKDTFKELDADGVLAAVTASLALPLVVKPARSGSAQGVTIVRKAEDLSRAMIDAYVYCDVAIVERFVEGTELAISVIDPGWLLCRLTRDHALRPDLQGSRRHFLLRSEHAWRSSSHLHVRAHQRDTPLREGLG